MKRTPLRRWPLIVRAANGLILHISDRNSEQHTCGMVTRCGRDIHHNRSVSNLLTVADFDICDETRKTGWMRMFSFCKIKKTPVLCSRCGTIDDFKQAHGTYLGLKAEQNHLRDEKRNHRKELGDRIVAQINEEKRLLFQVFAGNEGGIPLELNETDDLHQLYVTVCGRRYKIIHDVAIDDEAECIMKTEKSDD